MNKERRKSLEGIVKGVRELIEQLQDVDTEGSLYKKIHDPIDNAKVDVEDNKDGEQEYFDNMPEGLQSGEKGSAAEQAVSDMEDAVNILEEAVEAFQTIVEKLEEAADKIDEVINSQASSKQPTHNP